MRATLADKDGTQPESIIGEVVFPMQSTFTMTENRAKPSRRPVTEYFLLTALVFQGLSGVAGGFGLVADSTGASIGLPIEWLQGSPFDDYLIPGVILFGVLGIFPLLAAAALWQQHARAGLAAFLVGTGLTIWIGVEILIIGYHASPPLQLIYGLLGIAILALTAANRFSTG